MVSTESSGCSFCLSSVCMQEDLPWACLHAKKGAYRSSAVHFFSYTQFLLPWLHSKTFLFICTWRRYRASFLSCIFITSVAFLERGGKSLSLIGLQSPHRYGIHKVGSVLLYAIVRCLLWANAEMPQMQDVATLPSTAQEFGSLSQFQCAAMSWLLGHFLCGCFMWQNSPGFMSYASLSLQC